MRKLLIGLLSLSMGSSTLSGCASIAHGGNQKITLNSSPEGADVLIKAYSAKEREMRTITPSVVSLSRKREYQVVFQKAGFETQTRQITKTMDGWLLGNLLLGGVIGIVLDFCTGSSSKLEPSNIHVDMKKKESLS